MQLAHPACPPSASTTRSSGAAVGLAVGIVRPPEAYEVAHNPYMKLYSFDADDANRLLQVTRDDFGAIG